MALWVASLRPDPAKGYSNIHTGAYRGKGSMWPLFQIHSPGADSWPTTLLK